MIDRYVDWKGWHGVDFGSFTHEHALYYAAELKKSGIKSLCGLHVGELGFGNGGFAGWVNKTGGKWTGREAITILQQRAVLAGYEVVATDESFSEVYGHNSLDLIVAFDVLEHLPIDVIQRFLSESKDALKPGGILLFRVPSGDSPFSSAIYRGDLTHQTLLGSSAVRQMAEAAGLEISQIRSPVLPVWGLGPLRAARRLVIHTLQFIVFTFIEHVLMNHAGAVISPNMIVVLRKESIYP
jgi:SAM-dependent methyltransferase